MSFYTFLANKIPLGEKFTDYKTLFELSIHNREGDGKLAICIGFNPWKRDWFHSFIPNPRVYYVRGKTSYKKILYALKNISEAYEVYIWGISEQPQILEYLKANAIPYHRVEDGFVRSVGLGADKVPPLSLAIDDEGIYYDPHSKSKLEKIVSDLCENITEEQKNLAREYIDVIVRNGISKYNLPEKEGISESLKKKIETKNNQKVILVIGQVSDDASILRGAGEIRDSAELVMEAKRENPSDIILYRPHPDVWHKKRKESTDLAYISTMATVVPPTVSLNQMWDIVDTVYTITSLTGFEALLRNRKVICFGLPFYAGYGLTEDRIKHPTRHSKPDLETLFYAAYMEYPSYTNETLETTLSEIIGKRNNFISSVGIENYTLVFAGDEITTVDGAKLIDILTFTSEPIALVVSKSEITPIANTLLSCHDSTDIITLSHVVERKIRDRYPVGFREIFNLEKRYISTHSETEQNITALYNSIELHLLGTLVNIFGDIFGKDGSRGVSLALMRAFKDRLFRPFSHYFSLLKLVDEYKHIIVYVHDVNDPFIKLTIGVLKRFQLENKFIFLTETHTVEALVPMFSVKPSNNNTSISVNEIKSEVNSYWYSIKAILERFSTRQDDEVFVPVCLQMNGRNYAYYPAGKEIAESIIKAGFRPLLIPSGYVDNQNVMEEWKAIAFEDGLSAGGAIIYNIGKLKAIPDIKKLDKAFNVTALKLYKILMSRVSEQLPNLITEQVEPAIKFLCDGLKDRLLFACDMDKLLDKAPVAFMAPERPELSRIVAAICRIKNIVSVSLQHMTMSDSTRYDSPVVSYLGVMDTMQKDVYIKLGYSPERITLVGSANLRQRYEWLKKYELFTTNKKQKYILFGMQHSTVAEMLKIYELLKNSVSQMDNVILAIKPHPHQEQSVIDFIRDDIDTDKSKIILAEKDADTYQMIYESDVVVGLFSNVLLEAALYADKRVLVISDDGLSDTIDFSGYGLAVKVETQPEKVKNTLNDMILNGPLAQRLDETRKKYQQENVHLYDPEFGIKFVQSFLKKGK